RARGLLLLQGDHARHRPGERAHRLTTPRGSPVTGLPRTDVGNAMNPPLPLPAHPEPATESSGDLGAAPIALTGATGYVGGRLLERLQQLGHPVRCLSRDPERLAGRMTDGTEAVGADVLDTDRMAEAMAGVD